MNAKQKMIIAAASLLGPAAACVLWWGRTRGGIETHASQVREQGPADQFSLPARSGRNADAAPSPSPVSTARTAIDGLPVPAEVEKRYEAYVESFFEPGRLGPDGRFARAKSPVTWHRSCAEQAGSGAFADLTEEMGRRALLSLDRIPQGHLVHALNQYFTDARRSRFLQLSLAVEGESVAAAPRYVIDLHETEDRRLTRERSRTRLAPGPGEPALGQASALKLFSDLLEDFRAQGLVMGARTTVIGSKDAPGDVVELRDGKAVRFEGNGLRCNGLEDVVCTCGGGTDPEAGQE